MDVSVIAIGDELLNGQVSDTNSGDIARMISPAGWRLKEVMVVHDDPAAIRDAVERAMLSSKVVLTTGGLGPTKDDITKSTLMGIFGGEMIRDEEVLDNIKEVFRKRNLPMNRLTADQAMVPSSCLVIQNRVGTAPIMWFEKDDRVLVSMPGVPFETHRMFADAVFPALLERFAERSVVMQRNLLLFDQSESKVAEMIEEWENALPQNLHLAYLPQPEVLRLRIDGAGIDRAAVEEQLDKAHSWLLEKFSGSVLADHDTVPAQVLLDELGKRNLSVCTAESCTGGNIAHTITEIPGASASFNGGVVSYSNDVKESVLGVKNETLVAYGAVSEPVVVEMAEGVRAATHSDLAVATSGIAGPGGGSEQKPVGTVCIAVAGPHGTVARTFRFPGSRDRVIDRATRRAIIMLVTYLRGMDSADGGCRC